MVRRGAKAGGTDYLQGAPSGAVPSASCIQSSIVIRRQKIDPDFLRLAVRSWPVYVPISPLFSSFFPILFAVFEIENLA